ncbi:MAG TPA: sensor domain-containing protein [Arenimonas sp.]|uniref:sensor domain-containing protein n=1 Tax=Arenimonas sp. TaxID=1872635 RepID=UPI002D7EB216|nr:sensor domain-containing protein [Arenimonas sp.]HEU0153417.1 sensor domain-containing protein [Arenimonas sp.]
MNNATPNTIPEYLEALRYELRDADPALLQDALYDAEEYLRSELAENPGMDEARLLASIAGSYGAPAEVAAIYRDTEVQVAQALRTPPPAPRASLAGRFFGVMADSRAWTALFYMLLSLATGLVYFTVVVAGLSTSAGLAVLIIGIPVVILFVGIVRLLSLVEGRLVESMLGERMPRRPLYVGRGQPLMTRIGAMFTDPRTWSTMLYMVLMMPLGILYFTVAVTGLSTSVGMVAGAIAVVLDLAGLVHVDGNLQLGPFDNAWIGAPVMAVLGVLVLFVTLHLARGIGRLHGGLAKHLLVKTAQH